MALLRLWLEHAKGDAFPETFQAQMLLAEAKRKRLSAEAKT